jgi:hypothetical protein
MNDYLPNVLCQLVVSYLDTFGDIYNLINFNFPKQSVHKCRRRRIYIPPKPTYIYESEIYATFYPHSKEHSIEYLKIFPNLRVVNFSYYNAYVDDDLLKNFSKVHTLHLGDYSLVTDDGLLHLSNLRELYVGKGSKITDNGIKLLNVCIIHRAEQLYKTNMFSVDRGYAFTILLESVKDLLSDVTIETDP